MCYLLTVAAPARNAEAIGWVFYPDFQTTPVNPRLLGSAIPDDYAKHFVTRGFCSCDLFVGRERPTGTELAEELREKYRKRGWNLAKVERAISQATTARGRSPDQHRGLCSDIVEKVQRLAELIDEVRVFVHWYSGDPESETLQLERLASCGLAELQQRAAELEEDQVLVVKKISVP